MRCTLLLLLTLGGVALAQDEDKNAAFTKALLDRAEEEYRLYFKRPEQVLEFWAAMKYEMEVGKLDLAALHLKLMLAKIDEDPAAGQKELAKIEEAEGLSSFLKLANVRKWSDHAPFQIEAETNVKGLADRVTTSLENHLSDPERIKKFIQNLDASTPEERNYAFVQLNRSRARATPYLVEALRVNVDKSIHRRVFEAMLKMSPEILPPLYEILKAPNPQDAAAVDLRLTVLDLLDRRGDVRVTPYLWHLSESLYYPPIIRAKAKSMLSRMLNLDPARLPPAKIKLTELAEQYFQHKVRFADPQVVLAWPWNGATLALKPVVLTHANAEEIFGMWHAREALAIDPTYKPAQMVMLHFGLERRFASKLDKLLVDKMPAGFQEMLSLLDAELLVDALERALTDRNIAVAVPIIRSLGERGVVRAARENSGSPRGIVRALYYPDRRVQFAALQAMLQMPPPQSPVAAERMVDVLRRFLAAGKTPKALVLYTPEDSAAEVRQAIKDAGFEPVLARNTREAFAGLMKAADFDCLFIHHTARAIDLPYAVAELRQDIDHGQLPLVLFSTDAQEPQHVRMAQRHPNTWVVPAVMLSMPDELKKLSDEYIAKAAGAPLTAEERELFTRTSMETLWRMSRGELASFNVRPALDAVIQALGRDDLSVQAVEILGRQPGTPIQERLADITLDPARGKLRTAAAIELNRHIKTHGVVLDRRRLMELKSTWLNAGEEPELRNQLALVLGNMRTTPQQTGVQLYQFDPFAEVK